MTNLKRMLATAGLAITLGACAAPPQERAVVHGDCTVSPCQASGQRSVLIHGDYHVVATPVTPVAAPAPRAAPAAPRAAPPSKPRAHCSVAGGCAPTVYEVALTPPAVVPCKHCGGGVPQPDNARLIIQPKIDCDASGGTRYTGLERDRIKDPKRAGYSGCNLTRKVDPAVAAQLRLQGKIK